MWPSRKTAEERERERGKTCIEIVIFLERRPCLSALMKIT